MSSVFARSHKVVKVIIISIVITVIVIIIFVVFLVSLSLSWHSRRWLLPCQVSSICPTSCGFVSLLPIGYFCDRQIRSVPQAVVLFHSLVTSVTGKSDLSHKLWFCFTPWLLLWQANPICPTSCGSVSLPGYFCDRQVPSVPQAVVLFHSLVISVTGKSHLSHKPWFCFTPRLLLWQASSICPTSRGSVSLPPIGEGVTTTTERMTSYPATRRKDLTLNQCAMLLQTTRLSGWNSTSTFPLEVIYPPPPHPPHYLRLLHTRLIFNVFCIVTLK